MAIVDADYLGIQHLGAFGVATYNGCLLVSPLMAVSRFSFPFYLLLERGFARLGCVQDKFNNVATRHALQIFIICVLH